MNRLTLNFIGKMSFLEKEFRQANMTESLPRIRSALLLVTFLYVFFGLLDAHMAHDVKEIIWIIRFLIIFPCGMLVFSLTFTPFFLKYSQPLLFCLCYLGAAGIIAMIGLTPDSPASSSYYVGLILIIITIHTYLQMDITWGALCTLGIIISYEIVTIFTVSLSRDTRLNNNFFFLSAAFICIAAGYLNEVNVRSRYLLQHFLNREKEKVISQKKKMEILGTLSGGIAHDFNNMLTSLQGYTELSLRETSPGSPTLPYLEEVFRVSRRAQSMTGEILQFIREDKSELDFVHVEKLLKGVEEYIRPLLSENILYTRENHTGKEILADENMLHRILINLCTNSLQAMNGQKGILRVEAFDISENELCLRVIDTGPGIASERQKIIFEPYYTTKADEYGTGLGLFVVKQLTERLGGRIELKSEEGKGAVFSLFLAYGKRS